MAPGGWVCFFGGGCLVPTLAQMLAALTTGKSPSALGRTVTSSPGKRCRSFASYFSAGPTVSTNTWGSPGPPKSPPAPQSFLLFPQHPKTPAKLNPPPNPLLHSDPPSSKAPPKQSQINLKPPSTPKSTLNHPKQSQTPSTCPQNTPNSPQSNAELPPEPQLSPQILSPVRETKAQREEKDGVHPQPRAPQFPLPVSGCPPHPPAPPNPPRPPAPQSLAQTG